jgi:hypothetical protein
MFVDTASISWVGPTSIGVEKNGVTKAFSLEEGQVVPPEFKKGEVVQIHLHGDITAAVFGISQSAGYYMLKHVASGVEFKTFHRAEAFKFDASGINPL